jgi:hypothetical protein
LAAGTIPYLDRRARVAAVVRIRDYPQGEAVLADLGHGRHLDLNNLLVNEVIDADRVPNQLVPVVREEDPRAFLPLLQIVTVQRCERLVSSRTRARADLHETATKVPVEI